VTRPVRQRDRVQGDEGAAQAETLDQSREDDRLDSHGEREPAHLPHRERGQKQPEENDQPVVDAVDQAGNEEPRDLRADAARRFPGDLYKENI